jgi:hypothetical protein
MISTCIEFLICFDMTAVDVDRYRFESGQYIRARCAGCQMRSSLVPFPGEVVQLNPLEQVSSWVVCRVLVGRESRACSPRREAGCSECSAYSCADFVALIRRCELEKDVRVQKKLGGKPPQASQQDPAKESKEGQFRCGGCDSRQHRSTIPSCPGTCNQKELYSVTSSLNGSRLELALSIW